MRANSEDVVMKTVIDAKDLKVLQDALHFYALGSHISSDGMLNIQDTIIRDQIEFGDKAKKAMKVFKKILKTQEQDDRIYRHGAHVFEFAKKLGWEDDGEGPLEYIQRLSYRQGLDDGSTQPGED